MGPESSVLVALILLVDRLPEPPRPTHRRRGRPPTYSDRLFLKALAIMIVKHLTQVHTLLAVLEQPTPEMRRLRALLTENGRYPTRRTWERRLKRLPASLPAQIACLGDTPQLTLGRLGSAKPEYPMTPTSVFAIACWCAVKPEASGLSTRMDSQRLWPIVFMVQISDYDAMSRIRAFQRARNSCRCSASGTVSPVVLRDRK